MLNRLKFGCVLFVCGLLACGEKAINTDGVFSQVFQSRKQEPNAPVLSSLSVSTGELSPSFNPYIKTYFGNTNRDTLTLEAKCLDPAAVIQSIGGMTRDLQPGENIITITVSPADGSAANEYTIHMTSENFLSEDQPSLLRHDQLDYELLMPWNYDKPFNAQRKYPLVVSLHGAGGSSYTPCIAGNPDEMKQYPCFFMAPTAADWGASADWVRSEMVRLINDFRIDENRIYLIGFSMGGSGSYIFANSLWNDYGKVFAGIVRLSGQSQTKLVDAIADRTSVWYHIGLDDIPVRVNIAGKAYRYIKKRSANAEAIETIDTDEVTGHSRRTKTLTLRGLEIAKLSEYTDVGHSASEPFKDPAVLKWLFSQTLENR